MVMRGGSGRLVLAHGRPGDEGWVGLTAEVEVRTGRVHADDDAQLLLHLGCEE